jgi:hypothetical protein
MKSSTFFAAAVTIASLVNASAQYIVNEDFESYSTTAQMQANWGSAGLGVLVSTNGNPGNSAYHPGGAVNIWSGSTFSLAVNASQNVVLTADIFDSAVGSAQRDMLGLRNGANPLFEMGHYNSVASQYAVRLVSLYGQNAYSFFPNVVRTAGWNRYQATFTGSGATITLDLGADGSIDSTLTFSGTAPSNPFVDLRFGGPSGVTSAAPAWFDNISLQVIAVPEPTSATLLLVGGLLLAARIRRQR